MDKVYIHRETGYAYKLDDSKVLAQELGEGNYVLHLSDSEWYEIDPYYGEPIDHEGSKYTVSEFEQVIRDILS